MTYVGDFATGVTVRHMWNTNAVAGESITRGTNGTVQVYKDGGLTQSTAGVTDSEDFDGLTGVHLVAIDTSADGTFYSTGSDFHVVVAAAAIDGKTINAFLFSFSLNNRSLQARIPAALVSGRIDASVGAMAANVLTATAINADAITAAKIADGAIDAATFAANAITAAKLDPDVTTELQAGLATSTALAALVTDIGTDGAGLTAIPWNAAWDAEVQSEATDALNAYDGPTHAELTAELATADDAVLAAIAALNNLSAAAVNAEVVDALNVDTYAEPTGVPAATASLVTKIGRTHQWLRNRFDVTATDKTFYNDAGAALWKKPLSDDGTTYTEAEGVAP